MEDIAPGLLLLIRAAFTKLVSEDPKIQNVYRNISEGKASYADAEEYAQLVGQALSGVFLGNFSADLLPDGKLYYNIANRVIRPMLEEDHAVISDAAMMVQKHLNEQADISMKPQKALVNQARIDGIVDKVSSDDFESVQWVLEEPIVNFSMNVVDETIRQNVEFQGKSGLTPRIIRRATGKCCRWCRTLAGIYDYPELPHDVYRRHENCRCIVEYDPGGSKMRQNVHTKQWTSADGHDKLEERKTVGADAGYYLTAKERLSKKKLKNGFSAFPEGDVLNEYVTKVQPKAGFYDVAMHGSTSMVAFGSQCANMTARQLANYLKHQDSYKGGPVRLLSCSTGKREDSNYCFAEDLANALGADVEAPNKKLYIHEDGQLTVGNAGNGKFVLYKPNERRRLR